MNTNQIARVCHQVNKAYCEAIGDTSQVSWELAPEWQILSAIKGVEHVLNNPTAKPSDSHESWLKEKNEEGWVYGEKKDVEKKTHHCIVPYEELPEAQKIKDVLFINIVKALM